MPGKWRTVLAKSLSLFLVTVLLMAWPGPGGSAGGEPLTGGVRVSGTAATGGPSDEAAVLESLFDLDIKLTRVQEERARLSGQIANLEDEVHRTEIRRDQANIKMAEQQQAVSDWLRFVYEDGDVSFLAVLLESRDFGDFVAQWELLSLVMKRQTEFLGEVRDIVASAKRQQESLTQLRSSLQKQRKRVAALEVSLAGTLAEKERTFLQIRRLGPGVAGSMAESEARWVAAVTPLVRLFARFPSIPWAEAEPSEVNVDYRSGRVVMTIPAVELERLIRGFDPADQNLRLSVQPGELIISVPPPEGDPQQGGLAVAGQIRVEGKGAVFIPSRLSFRGAALSRRVLQSLADGYDLKINVQSPLPGLNPSTVKTASGKLILDLEI